MLPTSAFARWCSAPIYLARTPASSAGPGYATCTPLNDREHPAWAKDTRDCWEKLQCGDDDWAHLAYTIWPEREREKCRHDRSLAIAHGLEVLHVGLPAGARRRGRAAVEESEPEEVDE